MDRVFNRGVGMVLVVDVAGADATVATLASAGLAAVVIGEVAEGSGVRFA
jgi:phosphoribosylaminoimidazole (AIR) synthetase